MLRRFLVGPVVALVLGLVLVGTGCAKQVSTPGSGGGGGGANNPTPGVVDNNAGFYVRYVTTDKYFYDLHKGLSAFNTACVASKNESIDCYLDAPELDLFYNGVTLQYNVPSDMCTYLRFASYHFVRFPVESSPSRVNVDTDRFGTVCFDANSDGTCGVGESDQRCAYDYTGAEGPNCCEGRYTSVSRAWDATNNVYGTPVTSVQDWGGQVGNCLSGPATLSHPKNKSNVPLATITFVESTGLNKTYEVKAPIEQGLLSNAFLANFWDPVDHGGGTPAGLTATTAVAPNPIYRWQCLDRAEDVVSEIKLYVREWNTKAAFDARLSSPTGYDATGPEDPPFGPANPKNDSNDWKDFDAVYPSFSL